MPDTGPLLRTLALFCPFQQSIERRAQGLPPIGEAIFHLWRDLVVHNAPHNSIRLHLTQLLDQHLLSARGDMRGIKMIKELPLPIQAYVSALNQHDIDAMLLPFSKKATVLDEGQTYDGHVDIRRWMEETTRKYGVTAEVSGVAGAAAAPRVSMLISGNFPGSPITLTYSFALEGGLISRLEITV